MEKRHYSTTASSKHKVWRYIRRNRRFSFVDVIIVCGVTEKYLKTILWHLSKAEYIKQINTEHSIKKRIYVHHKDAKFGIKSPSIVNGIVHDLNTGKTYDVKPEKKEKELKERFVPIALVKVLTAMKKEKMTKEQIIKDAKVSVTSARKHWSRIELSGIMKEALNLNRKTINCTKYLRKNGKKVFNIDIDKAKLALENIQNGGYNKTGNFKLQKYWEPLDLLKHEINKKSQGVVAKEVGVSKGTVNLLVNEKYPNPTKMYERIKQKYGGCDGT